jgi:glycosyltransferase involved in cell wall biosynthesis
MNAALILPARDEAECIARVVREVQRYIDGEIIVVDNGSRDATAEQAAAAGARVVSEPVPGYGRACMAGVRAAPSADVLVFMDADGSDCPEDIPHLIEAIAGGADLALGVRTGDRVEPGSIAPAARFGNWLSGMAIGLWSGRRLRDLSPLKAVTRQSLRELSPRETTYGWTVELLAVAASRKFAIAEVPVGYRHRLGGRSKVSGTLSGSFRAGWRILFVLGRVFMKSRSARAIGGLVGFLLSLLVIGGYTLWLFQQAPSSRDVLVSSWLLAWPVCLIAISLGMLVAAVFRSKRTNP